jgi:PilZ domain
MQGEHGPDDAGDRRGDLRRLTCYPFHIQTGEMGDTSDLEIALIRDLSTTGALLLTREHLEVGARVKLHLDVFGRPDEVRLAIGHVVRSEARAPEESDVWPFAIAVQLDEPQVDLAPAIEELARITGTT